MYHVGSLGALPSIHVVSHSGSRFLTPLSLFLWPPSFIAFLLSPLLCLQMAKRKQVARRRLLTSHLYTALSLSLPVSFYPHSFLNQEKVAWARPGVCQKITPPVWVPAPGLWLAAWRRLCSWLSTPYRSARRKEGGRGGVLFTRLILRRLNLSDMNDICEWRKTKGKRKKETGRGEEEKKMLKIAICRICRLFGVLLRGTGGRGNKQRN